MPRGTPSTQINITLGAEGLSEKAAMLQSAARQAQIEKERTQRIAAEGAEKREANQAAKGKDANANPLYGAPTTTPSIDRCPAASRRAEINILLVPDQDYNAYGVLAKTKKVSNLNFTDTGFVPGDAPFKKDKFNLVGFPGTAANAFETTSTSATSATNVFELWFIVVNSAFVQGISTTLPPTVRIDGQEQAWTSSVTAKDLPIYTAEVYFRAGDGTPIPTDIGGVGSSCRLYIMKVVIGIELSSPFDGPYNYNIGIFDQDADFQWIVPTLELGDVSLGPAQGQWRHLAYVRDRTESRFYLDGVLLGRGENYTGEFGWDRDAPIQGRVTLLNGGNFLVDSAFHGCRVTPRALYTSNFTPPPSITNFA